MLIWDVVALFASSLVKFRFIQIKSDIAIAKLKVKSRSIVPDNSEQRNSLID